MNPPKPDDAPADSEQLEETRRELERLTRLRRDVASGLLEVSEAARRDAEKLLSQSRGTDASTDKAILSDGDASGRGWSSPFLYGSFALGILCGFLLALSLGTPDGPSPEGVVGGQPSPETAPSVAAPDAAEPPPLTDEQPALSAGREADALPQEEATSGTDVVGLVLTLRTHRACWLSVRVDGGDTVERLLPPNETVVLEVEEEATLRIGDAAALSLLINDRATRSLGRDGQVVQLHVTPANFRTFLEG